MGRPVSCPKEAPTYFGGKTKELWFIDEQYNRARDEFDWNLMNALIACGIGENRCPTEGQWVHFCVVSAVIAAETGGTLIMVPKSVLLNDVEKCSWDKFWNTFGDYNIPDERPKTLSLGFIESLFLLFLRKLILLLSNKATPTILCHYDKIVGVFVFVPLGLLNWRIIL